MKYKMSYLTDGTKVKITDELFNQLKKWETENIDVTDYFKDELKKQDNDWINKNRQYQRNTVSLEALMSGGFDCFFIDNSSYIEKLLLTRERKVNLECILTSCSRVQRKRFVLYFIYVSYREIARIEQKNKDTVKESIEKVIEMLKNGEYF